MTDRLTKAIKILKSLNSPQKIVKRNTIHFAQLMDILDHPDRNFKSIHITGTNGKGSVAIKTAAILQHSGIKTGVYTSPHLFTFRERIQINNQMISKEEISQNIIQIKQISQKINTEFSYFEYLTACGFMHFAKNNCEYVSLEVGLGGNNDTTNIVIPQVSVITSIGLDHTELLGPTKQHIAREKAGIIKKGRPVVLGPFAQGFEGIEQAIKEKGCEDYRVKMDDKFKDFEEQNNQIVRTCIKALIKQNPKLKQKITEQSIAKGLQARQPCRMELLKQQALPLYAKNKKIYFDVGHNPPAIQKIKEFILKKGYKKEQIAFVFGTSAKKKFNEALQQLEPISSHIYLIEAKHYRACKIQNLMNYVPESKYPSKYRCIQNGDIKTTLQYVTADPHNKVVVICGSFFIMEEARGFYEPDLVGSHQENLNEIYQLKYQPNQKQK